MASPKFKRRNAAVSTAKAIKVKVSQSVHVLYLSTVVYYTYPPHTVCHRSLGMGRYGGHFLLQGGEFQRFGNH